MSEPWWKDSPDGYEVLDDFMEETGASRLNAAYTPNNGIRVQVTGPIVIEQKLQPDGSINYELWDNGPFSFHRVDAADTRAKAEATAKKLTDAIAQRKKPRR